MRKLSILFLACFVALVVGLGTIVAWKVLARRGPAPPPPETAQSDYQIKEIRINETLEGNLRWTLDAERADVFDETRRTVMRKVVIRLYSKDGDWTVTADKGTLDNEQRDVSLEGNVVVATTKGLHLTTPRLSWRNSERNLFTKEDVEIRQAGMTITGRGLDVRMGDERAVVENNVRVVITDRTNANLSLFPRSGS